MTAKMKQEQAKNLARQAVDNCDRLAQPVGRTHIIVGRDPAGSYYVIPEDGEGVGGMTKQQAQDYIVELLG